MDQKIVQEAIDQLSKNERRHRDEDKQLVEYLIPILLGLLATVIASLNINIICNALSHNQFYNLSFKAGIFLTASSFFLGIFFLFIEKKFLIRMNYSKIYTS